MPRKNIRGVEVAVLPEKARGKARASDGADGSQKAVRLPLSLLPVPQTKGGGDDPPVPPLQCTNYIYIDIYIYIHQSGIFKHRFCYSFA